MLWKTESKDEIFILYTCYFRTRIINNSSDIYTSHRNQRGLQTFECVFNFILIISSGSCPGAAARYSCSVLTARVSSIFSEKKSGFWHERWSQVGSWKLLTLFFSLLLDCAICIWWQKTTNHKTACPLETFAKPHSDLKLHSEP